VLKDVPAGVTAVGVPAKLLPPLRAVPPLAESADGVALSSAAANGHQLGASTVSSQLAGWNAPQDIAQFISHDAP
jgi:hypothetical protein